MEPPAVEQKPAGRGPRLSSGSLALDLGLGLRRALGLAFALAFALRLALLWGARGLPDRAAALVVGRVEAASLKDDSQARADESLEPGLLALGTLGERVVGDLLQSFEPMATRLTLVIVSRHELFPDSERI